MTYLSLFMGSVIGGILRYGLGLLIPSPDPFPAGILLINLSGSLVLGMFYAVAEIKNIKPWIRVGFGTGLIGAYTTFSTFVVGLEQLSTAHLGLAALYGFVSIIGGPLMAFAGDYIVITVTRRIVETSEEFPA